MSISVKYDSLQNMWPMHDGMKQCLVLQPEKKFTKVNNKRHINFMSQLLSSFGECIAKHVNILCENSSHKLLYQHVSSQACAASWDLIKW